MPKEKVRRRKKKEPVAKKEYAGPYKEIPVYDWEGEDLEFIEYDDDGNYIPDLGIDGLQACEDYIKLLGRQAGENGDVKASKGGEGSGEPEVGKKYRSAKRKTASRK